MCTWKLLCHGLVCSHLVIHKDTIRLYSEAEAGSSCLDGLEHDLVRGLGLVREEGVEEGAGLATHGTMDGVHLKAEGKKH